MERGKEIFNVKKNLKSCVESMEDKAKKFTESPEMKWFMGFKA